MNLAIASCGGTSQDSQGLNQIDLYSVSAGQLEQVTASSVSGSATLAFAHSLGSSNASVSLFLTAALPEANSSITIVTQASTDQLSDGNQLILNKNGLGISGALKINQNTQVSIPAGNLSQLSGNSFSIVVETIDYGTSVLYRMWPASLGTFLVDTAVFDSTTDLLSPLPTDSGSGARWGIILNQAQITRAQMSLGSPY